MDYIIICGGNMDDILQKAFKELKMYVSNVWKDNASADFIWSNYFKCKDKNHYTEITLTPCLNFDIKTCESKIRCIYFTHYIYNSQEIKFIFSYNYLDIKADEHIIIKDFANIHKDWLKLCEIKDETLYNKQYTAFIKKYQIENDFSE